MFDRETTEVMTLIREYETLTEADLSYKRYNYKYSELFTDLKVM